MKSSQGSAPRLVIHQAWIGQSVKKSLLARVFFRCRMRHVNGAIFVECFFIFFCSFSCHTPFHVYYCVISIHIRYFPVYVWLLVMYHWLSVSLTTARVLCLPSNLYMPVHPMCNNHCNAFNVSPPLLVSLRLALCHPWPLWKSTSWDNIKNCCHSKEECHVLESNWCRF